MNETLKYIIDHSPDFGLVGLTCVLLLHAIKGHIPVIGQFICDLIKILFGELKGTQKTRPAQINALMLILFFLIAMVSILPSAIKHIFGAEIGGDNASETFNYAIFFLFILSIGSPIWLYLIEREKGMTGVADKVIGDDEREIPAKSEYEKSVSEFVKK